MTLVGFSALERPVLFEDGTDRLLATLDRVAGGWPRDDRRRAGEPLIRVDRPDGRYRIRAPWLDEPMIDRTEFRTAGSLAVDLVEAYLAENPAIVCLHCGSVEIGGRLVLFPSRSRAGKSTLVGRLAAEGLRIFGDDVLFLGERGEGMSVGIAPRLRLPLPDRADPRFRAFVDAHSGPGDRRYRYLDLPEAQAPRFGMKAPIGAIVLLDRREEESPARLARATGGDGMQELIMQNIATGVAFPAIVERMHRMAGALPCYQLTYRDLDDAAGLLLRAFADRVAIADAQPLPAAPQASADASWQADPPQDDVVFRPAPSVALHAIDGEGFLVPGAEGGLYRLNPVSAGLWNLLGSTASIAAASEILAGAFPDTDPALIRNDVRRIFAELAERGLIVREG